MAFCKLQTMIRQKIANPQILSVNTMCLFSTKNRVALLSPCSEEAASVAFPDLSIKTAWLMEWEDEAKAFPTDNRRLLTVTVSLLFFRHRDLLHFRKKGNRFISKNHIQAHLEFNSQCCINGCHFLPVLVPADTGLEHPDVHQSCSCTPACSKIHPRVQSETKWFFNCVLSLCSQGSVTNALLQIWNLKNHVVKEISARNRLASSWEQADGS